MAFLLCVRYYGRPGIQQIVQYVGKRLAMLELRRVVAEILRWYDLTIAPDGKQDTFTTVSTPLPIIFTHAVVSLSFRAVKVCSGAGVRVGFKIRIRGCATFNLNATG